MHFSAFCQPKRTLGICFFHPACLLLSSFPQPFAHPPPQNQAHCPGTFHQLCFQCRALEQQNVLARVPRAPMQAAAHKPVSTSPEHLLWEERCSFPPGVAAFRCVVPAACFPAFGSGPANTEAVVGAQPQTLPCAHICQEHLAGPPRMLPAVGHPSLAAFKRVNSVSLRDAPLSLTAKPGGRDICHHRDEL